MPFTGNDNHIPRLRFSNCLMDSFRSIYYHLVASPLSQGVFYTYFYIRHNLDRVLHPRIIRSHKDPVPILGRKTPHNWPLSSIPVTTTTKDYNNSVFRNCLSCFEDIFQAIWRMGIVYYNSKILPFIYQFKTTRYRCKGG